METRSVEQRHLEKDLKRFPERYADTSERNIKEDKTVDKVRGKHPQKVPGSDAEASAPEQTPEEADESLEHDEEVLRFLLGEKAVPTTHTWLRIPDFQAGCNPSGAGL